MPARQGRVRVNQINGLRAVQFAHPPYDAGKQECTSGGEPEACWQGKIPKPLRGDA
jgi:hypothetical protein